MLYVIVICLTVLVAILLIGIVLIQKSKGGGLSSQFGGAGAVMGVRQTNNILEKGTWILAGVLGFLAIISAFTMPRVSTAVEIRTQAQTEAPAAPANQFDIQVPANDEAPAVVADEAANAAAATVED